MAAAENLYSPSQWSPRLPPEVIVDRHIAYVEAASARNRQTLPCIIGLPYGPTREQTFDWFAPPAENPCDRPPLVIYIHGGYWQALSVSGASFWADPLLRNERCCYAGLGYDLAPAITLNRMIDQVAMGIATVVKHGQTKVDGGISCVWLVGHSAGAHLVAEAMLRLPTDYADLVRGLVLISGIYDLLPLVNTTVNDAMQLTSDDAFSLSPTNHVRELANVALGKKVLIAYAEYDSPAFKEQSIDYGSRLSSLGVCSEVIQVSGVDHFDITEKLTDGKYELYSKITGMLRK